PSLPPRDRLRALFHRGRVITRIDFSPSSATWSTSRPMIVPSAQGRTAAGASPAPLVATSTAVFTEGPISRSVRRIGGTCSPSDGLACGPPSVKRVSAVPTAIRLVVVPPGDVWRRLTRVLTAQLGEQRFPLRPDHARLVRPSLLERGRAEPRPELRVIDEL